MGWANCGTDSEGRSIGYAHPATCDHPGCDAQIHRGLAYACGDMHGENAFYCEKYFCDKHQYFIKWEGEYHTVCKDCEQFWREEYPQEAAALDAE